MIALQLACAAIVATYLSIRMFRATAAERGAIARRMALLLVAAWIGEDSVIRAYGFYAYDEGWSLFLDRVPLLIVVIWPVVIDSAWSLGRALGRGAAVPVVAAAFVLADASLIEPVAVHAGLWRWTEPGLFSVPPVGILGWAFFAGLVVALAPRVGWLAVLLAPLGTHALLLGAWWGGLRWVSGPIPAWAGLAAVWGALLPVAAAFARRRTGAHVAPIELWARVPGAAFFFALLAVHHAGALPLLGYASAFVPPYLALLFLR